jgi:ribosomal protein L24E
MCAFCGSCTEKFSQILEERLGTSEVDGDGLTYSFSRSKIKMCIKRKTNPLLKITWTLSITPFSDRTIHSITMPSHPPHTKFDCLIATYAPEHTVSSIGMNTVHFSAHPTRHLDEL